MSALLETLKFRPETQGGTTNHEDFNSAEGKFGIPRFNGEATMLPEYTYRVRARAAKEKAMSKDEVEKLGPLGLRLVEGLRGQALRLAQQVNLTTLSSKDGAEALLKVFNETLKPRRNMVRAWRRCIPPPTSLGQSAQPPSPASPTTSRPVPTSLNLSSASGFAPTSLQVPSASGLAPTSLKASSASGFATTSLSAPMASGLALAGLGKASSEALVVSPTSLTREMASTATMAAPGFSGGGVSSIPRSFGVEHGVTLEEKDFMMIKEALAGGPAPEQGHLQAALQALTWMEVDSEGGELLPPTEPEPAASTMAFGSVGRNKYLDLYLEKTKHLMDDPEFGKEWRDAYNERWTEFFPGHPAFVESDLRNINRWKEKCRLGLPQLPLEPHALHQQPATTTAPPTTPQPAPVSQPTSTTTTTTTLAGTCQHLKTSRRGTNRHVELLTCLDCGVVLKREKKEAVTGGTSSTSTTTGGGVGCRCHRVTWKGSNGFQWKKTCLDCGSVSVGPRGSYAGTGLSATSVPMPPSSEVGWTYAADELAEIFNTCTVVAKVKSMEQPNQPVSADGLHRILDAVMASRSCGSAQGQQPHAPQVLQQPVVSRGHPKDDKLMTFGTYKGNPFPMPRWMQSMSNGAGSKLILHDQWRSFWSMWRPERSRPTWQTIAMLEKMIIQLLLKITWSQFLTLDATRPVMVIDGFSATAKHLGDLWNNFHYYLKMVDVLRELVDISPPVELAAWMCLLSWMKSLVWQLVISPALSFVTVMHPFCCPSLISADLAWRLTWLKMETESIAPVLVLTWRWQTWMDFLEFDFFPLIWLFLDFQKCQILLSLSPMPRTRSLKTHCQQQMTLLDFKPSVKTIWTWQWNHARSWARVRRRTWTRTSKRSRLRMWVCGQLFKTTNITHHFLVDVEFSWWRSLLVPLFSLRWLCLWDFQLQRRSTLDWMALTCCLKAPGVNWKPKSNVKILTASRSHLFADHGDLGQDSTWQGVQLRHPTSWHRGTLGTPAYSGFGRSFSDGFNVAGKFCWRIPGRVSFGKLCRWVSLFSSHLKTLKVVNIWNWFEVINANMDFVIAAVGYLTSNLLVSWQLHLVLRRTWVNVAKENMFTNNLKVVGGPRMHKNGPKHCAVPWWKVS